jgi:tryptophan 7-halogenase
VWARFWGIPAVKCLYVRIDKGACCLSCNDVTRKWGSTMSEARIKSVVVVGDGVAGWMSAAALATILGPKVAITLIETHTASRGPHTSATLPPLKAMHQMLGIDEAALLSVTSGSMKLGTQFVNWGALGDRYTHPHGSYGADFDLVGLHHWWLKARAQDDSTPDLASFSLAGELIKQSRFTHPVADRRMIQATLDYAYHLSSDQYCDFLAQIAKARGVSSHVADIVRVNLNNEGGQVESLSLSDGQTLDGDFFLDCSGTARTLISGALGVQFDDWSAFLPCDRAVSLMCQNSGDFSPCTRITAREAGWQWRAPLQGKTSMGYVYSSGHTSDEDVLSTLMDNLDGPVLGEPVYHAFKNGRVKTPFYKNVVAIGDAAGFLEPLEATGVHMVQSALTRLLALWPSTSFNPLLAREYNDVCALEWERARDFLILHYHATARTDSPLWRACKDIVLPEALAQRLAHWKGSGRLISPGPELFQSASWLSLYVGQNVAAEGWDPLADAREDQVNSGAKLSGLARVIAETAQSAPDHKAFIDKFAQAKRR